MMTLIPYTTRRAATTTARKWSRTARSWKRRKKDAQQGKPTQKKVYPECRTCGKENYPEERCLQGAGAHLKPKPIRPEDSINNNPNTRLQYKYLVSVRQYTKSDPPTKTFHNYQEQLMGYPFVVWQQQLEKATIITYNNTRLNRKPILF